ncbi:efflux RND transporter permease subunit [Thalassotalea hakodatensis]|uniref:efflux RND transporter permease subunit n=1 Tax=Thalassotalea hakodatensis TaxID=3030492 RepID=UPI0025738B1D|nr:MMPL family transporter [Thalassotalea hakodatensis]
MSNKSATIIEKIGEIILKQRILILIVFTTLFVILGSNALKFKIDASADTLLTKNNALYIKTQLANQKFSPDEFILVAYQPNSGDVFTAKTIEGMSKLSDSFARIERVSKVQSMLSVPLIQSKSQLLSNSNVSDLTYEKQQYSPEELRTLLTDHPIYTDLLVNQKQDAAAIQIVFKKNEELQTLNDEILSINKHLLTRELTEEENQKLESLKRQADIIEGEIGQQRQQELIQIEQIVEQAQLDGSVYIGGSYIVGIRLIEIVKQDLLYFGSGIGVLIVLLLMLLFRSIKWVLFPMFACASSILLTMGLLALLNLPATVISANFVALQLILTLAIMLHLITCYREVSREDPELTQHQRLVNTLKEKLAPCFFAALTTSVGFGSLIFSGIQPIIDFGIMMLISNIVTLSVALLLFPVLLSYFSASKESKEYAWLSNFLAKLGNKIKSAPRFFIIIPLVFMGILAVGISQLNVENSFIDYFHPDTKVYQELSFIDQQFGGSTPLDIVISYDEATNKSDLFMTAKQVNTLHLGHAVVNAFDATGNVTSLISFTKLAKQLNDGAPITEYELDVIYSMVDKETIDSLVGAYIDTDSNTMRISTRIQDTLPGLNRAEFLDKLTKDLNAAGLSEDQVELTNLFVLYQDILSRLFDSQITTLGIVYGVLALVLFAIFRSIKIALIALVPNIINTLGILGIIGWLGIPLDLMTITIAAIAMGIAIDDTIHFVDAYKSKLDGKPMQHAFSHTGLAIVYTSTLIATGFSMFVFSDFVPSVYFGLLTACAMMLAVITDLTVLPGLLKKYIHPAKPTPNSNQ